MWAGTPPTTASSARTKSRPARRAGQSGSPRGERLNPPEGTGKYPRLRGWAIRDWWRTCGHGLSSALPSGGSGMSSKFVTDLAPWRTAVPASASRRWIVDPIRSRPIRQACRGSSRVPHPSARGGGVCCSVAANSGGVALLRVLIMLLRVLIMLLRVLIMLLRVLISNAVKGTDNAAKGTDNAAKGTDNAVKGTDNAVTLRRIGCWMLAAWRC
jgi:hypothetical protein